MCRKHRTAKSTPFFMDVLEGIVIAYAFWKIQNRKEKDGKVKQGKEEKGEVTKASNSILNLLGKTTDHYEERKRNLCVPL